MGETTDNAYPSPVGHDADYVNYTYAPPAPKPPQYATRRFVLIVAAVATAVLIGAGFGISYWQSTRPYSTGLASRVKDSMNESFRADERFSDIGLQTRYIHIMHMTGNMFEGQAEVVRSNGRSDSVTVHIGYDGDLMFWRVDPGSFVSILSD
ncbi:hypothetical protein [Mycolicibacterium grossiae]|uniref:Uncharacterized protein n=1 Tax=Mycolicibacterium grossiae TaxID=1552759 RepID=A0A1E8Q2C5_9MYCO|nr:hypothetical protein [Mycolicibacterium grossiae]OFJ52567.1 hypothetical protein BEL07_17130 [Mycolicibacterium grossiae]QEM47171.1 hypothetical protein FZ046_22485 [Mycolicibacterium grossiae]